MRLISLLLLTAGFATAAIAAEPIACNMNALTREERERYSVLLAKMKRAEVSHTEITNGFEFRLDPTRFPLVELAEWITFESKCCPFLVFGVKVHKDGVRLALTGDKGVKEFLRAEMGI